jgi:hypothetical protein
MQLSALSLALGGAGLITIPQRVRAIFRKYGSDAHLYLPGVGTVSGFHTGNYLDSAGTTVATVDNPVGLVLDGAGSVSDTELSSTAGWLFYSSGNSAANVSVNGSVITFTPSSGTPGWLSDEITGLTIGKTYKLVYRINSASTSPYYFRVGSGIGLSENYSSTSPTLGQTQTVYIVATATSFFLSAGISSGGVIAYDSVSVREVTGIHASQATAGFKPVERRGVVNLLPYSNDMANAVWTKGVGISLSGVTVSGATGPTGSSAWGNANSVQHSASGLASSSAYTLAAYVKANTGDTVTLTARDQSTGAVVTSAISLTASYELVVANITTGAATTGLGLILSGANGSFDFSGAAIFQGTLTASQILSYGGIPITTTAAASSSGGNYFWQFDGTDDYIGSTFSAGAFGSNCDLVISLERMSSAMGVLFANNASSTWIGAFSAGDNGNTLQNCGAASSLFVDGVQIGTTFSATFDQLHQALTVGVPHVVEFRNVDLSSFLSLSIGGWAGWHLGAKVYYFDVTPALSSADRTTIRKFAAQQAGVTL